MAWLYLRDDVPIWYEDSGEGPVILFVPGWTFTTRFYDAQLRDLARDHRVVAVDLRGAGNSAKTREGHSLSNYAADLLDFLERLGLTDVVLVAWAMAVSVSVHLLARDHSRIRGLVWVDHSPRFFTSPDWPFALHGTLDPWAWDEQILALQLNRSRATRDLLSSSFFEAPRDADLDWMTAELMKTPTEVMSAMLATVANVDLRPFLPRIEVPVLLVNGRHSIVPVAVAEWIMQQVPTARSVVFENSGHVPYVEEPDRFNLEVRRFVAECAGRTAQ